MFAQSSCPKDTLYRIVREMMLGIFLPFKERNASEYLSDFPEITELERRG